MGKQKKQEAESKELPYGAIDGCNGNIGLFSVPDLLMAGTFIVNPMSIEEGFEQILLDS